MSVSAAGKLSIIIVVIMLLAALSAYLIPTCDDIYARKEAANKLRIIQTFKMKDNSSLKETVEKTLPGGQWHGTKYYASYSIGSKTLFWDEEGARVLAASGYTIKLFPELSPRVDKDALDTFHEDQPFNPFAFEQSHTIKSSK